MTFSEAYEKVFPRKEDMRGDSINKPMVEKPVDSEISENSENFEDGYAGCC